ncbi:MAG: Calx-beta domain-containing protein, partial [Verrucomicrobiota bacterium]
MKKLSLNTLAFLLVMIFLLGALPGSGRAQSIVFSEDFETDHSLDGTYRVNFTSSGVHLADLYFDYTAAGVPLSPHSTGTSTRALKMAANLVSPASGVTGVSVSPVGFGITSNFELRFDAWFNFNGPLPAGGSGSTQVGGAGYGTAGTTAQVAGVADSIYIGGTADGGSSADYRVYSPAHSVSYQDGVYQIGSSLDGSVKGDPASGFVYASVGGSRNASPNSYYETNFPPQAVPLAQFNLFPQQTNSSGTPANAPGSSAAGALAFKWHDVSLKKIANTITYSIDDILIATVDVTDAGTLGGTNILFNHYDINATTSSDPNRTNLIFTLIDNVRVTEYTNVIGIAATTPSAAETGTAPGVFTVSRSAAGTPLTINYKLSGTASNGVDYVNALGGPLSGSITFAPDDFSTNIIIVPIDDSIPEISETIVLSINPSINYVGAGSAIVTIADNENPQLTITNVSTQMYEQTNDYATFQVTRLGNLGAASFNANLSFSGSATAGVDFYTNSVLTFDPGVQTT